MRRRKGNRNPDQVGLFRPVSTTPSWSDLGQDVRERVIGLLARLLRERRERERGADEAGEVTHD